MSAVPAVTTATFDAEVLASPIPVVVDFWATWCGPCRQLAPVLDDVAAELAGTVKVVKVDIDAEPSVADRYGVMSVPTVLTFSGGQVVAAFSGAKPKKAILSQLADVV